MRTTKFSPVLCFRQTCFPHVEDVPFSDLVYRPFPLWPGASRHRRAVLSRVTELSGHTFVGHVYGSASHKRSRSRNPSWLSGSRTDRVGSALDSHACPQLSPLLSLPGESTAALTPVLALSLSNPGVEPGHLQAEVVLNLLLGFGLDSRCCVCWLGWRSLGSPLHSRPISLSTFLVCQRDSRRTCP